MLSRDPYEILVDSAPQRLRAFFGDRVLADSSQGKAVRETGLPVVYYFPAGDVDETALTKTSSLTFCPFKGTASHYAAEMDGGSPVEVAWRYENPLEDARGLEGYYAFVADKVLITQGPAGAPLVSETFGTSRSTVLSDWLALQAHFCPETETFVQLLGQQLIAFGMPLKRLSVTIRTLHPELIGRSFTWSRDEAEVKVAEEPRDRLKSPAYLKSPVRFVTEGRGGVRQRLDVDQPEFQFPIMDELREMGCTDYVAMPLTFSDGTINTLTLASDAREGFTTDQLGNLFLNVGVITRIIESHSQRQTTASLLDTYLGPRSSKRVRNGSSYRGDGETINAAILYCDLRDSTGLVERLEQAELLEVLNQFFEQTVEPIHRNGGEVLKLIGDAVLAIFPMDDAGETACRAAKRAAAEIVDAIKRVERPDGRRADCVIALHAGMVSYGNVGSSSRLDYTAIGPAVGQVVRMQDQAKALGRRVIFSAEIARFLNEPVERIGQFTPRGSTGEVEIFA